MKHGRYLRIKTRLWVAFNTNISVLGVTETKLSNNVSNDWLKIDDYNSLQSDRNKNSGGVACCIKKNFAHNWQSISIYRNMENIVLDILLPKSKSITVGIIFNNALGKLRFQPNEICLLRDFNIIF